MYVNKSVEFPLSLIRYSIQYIIKIFYRFFSVTQELKKLEFQEKALHKKQTAFQEQPSREPQQF